MSTSKKQLAANQQNALKSTGPRTTSGKLIAAQNSTTHGLCSQQIVIAGESQEEFNDFRNSLISSLAPVGPLEILFADIIVAGFWRFRRTGQIEAQVFDNLREDLCADRRANLPDPLLVTLQSTPSGSSEPETVDVQLGLALKEIFTMYLQHEFNEEVAFALARVEHTIEYFKQHPNTVYIPGLLQFIKGIREISVETDLFSEQDTRDLDKAIEDLSRIKEEILQEAKPNLGHAVSADFASSDILGKLTRYATQIQNSLLKAIHELERLQAARKGWQVPPPQALDINISGP